MLRYVTFVTLTDGCCACNEMSVILKIVSKYFVKISNIFLLLLLLLLLYSIVRRCLYVCACVRAFLRAAHVDVLFGYANDIRVRAHVFDFIVSSQNSILSELINSLNKIS